MFDETDDFDARAGEGDPADEDGFDDYEDEGDEPFEDAYDAEEDAAPIGAAGNGKSASPREDLQRLVHFLAANLVDDPEGVVVEAEQRGQTVSLTLRVPEDELGKVIGRQGRIARAIRTVLTIAGSRYNVRASLDIEG
jgi:predicted RNA-binding protein YlqC (UPF0109 family)